MARCINRVAQAVPKGYVTVMLNCGNTSIYGTPLYCSTCIAEAAARGHQKHECPHGIPLSNDDGSDRICDNCEAGE